jgi:RNA polymerase sigma-70 factor (ECF subfamily)
VIIPLSIRLFYGIRPPFAALPTTIPITQLDADDLVQETFLQAYEKLYQLREPAQFAGWLRGIAVNVSLMSLRSKKPEVHSMDSPDAQGEVRQIPDERSHPEQDFEAGELRETVRKMLQQLGEGERLATRLFYLEDLSIREISAFLGISTGAVKSRLYKARQKLQSEVHEEMAKQPELQKQIPIRPGAGYLHIHEKGYAFLRLKHGDSKDPSDLYVSQNQLNRFALQEGDHLDVEVRPPKAEANENYDAVIRVLKINGRETSVEGALDIVDEGWGFLRHREDGVRSEDDIYLSKRQIDRYVLELGDKIAVTVRKPKPGGRERYFAVTAIHKVNDEPAVLRSNNVVYALADKFDEAGQSVIRGAMDIAVEHGYVGTEHLLMKFVDDPEGRALMERLEGDCEAIRGDAETFCAKATKLVDPILYTPRVKDCLQRSVDEAGGTASMQDLLTSLVADENAVSAQVLRGYGIDTESRVPGRKDRRVRKRAT